MNTAQTLSLVRWLLTSISGGVLAYTGAKSPAAQTLGAFIANLITGPDCVAAGVLFFTWLWSHVVHSSSLPPSSNSGPSRTGGALRIATVLIAASFLFTGCASEKIVTTTKVLNGTTNTVTQSSRLFDPLLKKVVIQEDTFYGLNADIAGNSYVTPFKVKVGFGRTIYRSLPTDTVPVFTAPYNAATHGNASIINQTADESVSTSTNLAQFAPQSASVFNPVTGSFGASPIVGTDAKGNPIVIGTNAAAK